MPFSIYIGWGLLIPAGLSLLYGFTGARAKSAFGYPRKNTVMERLRTGLPALFLFTLWGMADLPLPAVYVAAFLGKLPLRRGSKNTRAREIFLIHLTHLMTMALHMILIGVCSLCTNRPMNELLRRPSWRIATIGAVLVAHNLAAWLLPRRKTLLNVLLTQSESGEVRPFLVFLWFCNVFLLLDSVLCTARIDWRLLPVFLIGSTVLLEFYLIRFLRNLYTLLKVRYLEEEHRKLTEELERRNLAEAELRSKSTRDTLTGIFSRRYAMEQAAFLLQSQEPFSLAYIDLDHLKQINDREGHHAGDLYLIRFAREFRVQLRNADVFARIGGDEFIVILPGCAQETAVKRLEEIRFLLEEECRPPLSFSYGVAFAAGDGGGRAEDILRRADRAMYRDKQSRAKA